MSLQLERQITKAENNLDRAQDEISDAFKDALLEINVLEDRVKELEKAMEAIYDEVGGDKSLYKAIGK